MKAHQIVSVLTFSITLLTSSLAADLPQSATFDLDAAQLRRQVVAAFEGEVGDDCLALFTSLGISKQAWLVRLRLATITDGLSVERGIRDLEKAANYLDWIDRSVRAWKQEWGTAWKTLYGHEFPENPTLGSLFRFFDGGDVSFVDRRQKKVVTVRRPLWIGWTDTWSQTIYLRGERGLIPGTLTHEAFHLMPGIDDIRMRDAWGADIEKHGTTALTQVIEESR